VTNSDSNITKTQPIPEEIIKNSEKHAHMHGRRSLSGKLWFAFITVFISGAAIGAVCIVAIMHNKIRREKDTHHPDFIKMRIISHISKELNLSPEQQQEAEKIISIMSKKIFEIRKAQQPEIQNIVKSSFSQIEDLLKNDQKIKFNKMQQRVGSWQLKGQPGKRCGSPRTGRMKKNLGGRGKMQHQQKNLIQ